MEDADEELLKKANELIKNVTPQQIREANEFKKDFDELNEVFFHHVSEALHNLISHKTQNKEILDMFPTGHVVCVQEKFYNGVDDDIAFIVIEDVKNDYIFNNEINKLEKYYFNDYEMSKIEFMKLNKKQQMECCVSKLRFNYNRLINTVLIFYKKYYLINRELFEANNLSTLYFNPAQNTIFFNKEDEHVLGIKIYLKSENNLPHLIHYK